MKKKQQPTQTFTVGELREALNAFADDVLVSILIEPDFVVISRDHADYSLIGVVDLEDGENVSLTLGPRMRPSADC